MLYTTVSESFMGKKTITGTITKLDQIRPFGIYKKLEIICKRLSTRADLIGVFMFRQSLPG